MIILFLIIVALVLFVADIVQDYYYIDHDTGEILFYYDNGFDYKWGKHN